LRPLSHIKLPRIEKIARSLSWNLIRVFARVLPLLVYTQNGLVSCPN
jgi:hypothetical protein